MIIPMLVLLAHDVIPHHHHSEVQTENNQVSVLQSHHHIHTGSCNSHSNSRAHWNHQHETNNENCCILTHNRVQKEVKYQIFLKADLINFDVNDTQKVQKFRVHNYQLIPEPLRFSPLRRGPPSLNLV